MINAKLHNGKFTVKNLAIHMASVTPKQADDAMTGVWWYLLIVTAIALIGALYFS